VTKWHGFRQVGNSVPPLLARAVASQLMEALGIKPSNSLRVPENRDGQLLKFDMSEAAEWFGVPRNVIPARRRAALDEVYA
jgi:DNA (cytosine-5)-methyltransferase 1